MSLSQVEKEIEKLQKELLDCNQERKKEIESQIKKQEEYYQHLSPYDHVYLARKSTRPNIKDYINHLFDDFIELHGDRLAKDDGSIVGGIGLFNQQPVTIIGHLKGKTLEDNLEIFIEEIINSISLKDEVWYPGNMFSKFTSESGYNIIVSNIKESMII